MTSGELLKQRNGFLIREGYGVALTASSWIGLTMPDGDIRTGLAQCCCAFRIQCGAFVLCGLGKRFAVSGEVGSAKSAQYPRQRRMILDRFAE